MRFLQSSLTNPFINLAIEDYLFKKFNDRMLFFYTNESCVILGRNQNPWREIDFKSLKRNGMKLVRRNSGGGAVYHDCGNINYCYMMPRSDFDRSTSVTLISAALQKLNIPASVSCRYDILVDEKKVSGSAFKLINSRAYHHGTMLINSNLDNLYLTLSPLKKSLEGGGITSVRSKVTNLTKYAPLLTPDIFCESVTKEFHQKFGAAGSVGKVEIIDESFLNPEIVDLANKLQESKWIYGQTPRFTHTHTLPNYGSLKLTIYQGAVEEFSILSSASTSVTDLTRLERDCRMYLVGRNFHTLLQKYESDQEDDSPLTTHPPNIKAIIQSLQEIF